MKPLHRERARVEGQKVDFIFLEDADFRSLILGSPQEFVKENQEGNVVVALIGYPSMNSVVPAGINFPLDMVQSMYPPVQ